MNMHAHADAPAFDLPTIRGHIAMLNNLAEATGAEGRLVVFAVGENPTGRREGPFALHFCIGDVDGMMAVIAGWESYPHLNIYCPWVVFRPDLPRGDKGSETDVIAALAFVADMDHDKGMGGALPLESPYVIESSPGNFQAVYPLSRALTFGEAKPIAQALADVTGCDSRSKDVCGVWRIPGTLNWPTRKKLERGRSSTPAHVTVAEPWTGELIDPEALRIAVAGRTKANGKAEGNRHANGYDTSADELLGRCGAGLRKLITSRADPGEDRSATAFSVIFGLLAKGFNDAEITLLFKAHPNGIGDRYVNGGKDLDADIRRAREKAKDGRQQEEKPKADQEKPKADRKKPPVAIVSSAAFLSTWAPQSFLWKGIIEEGRLLTMCGPTGTGKTAIALLMALAIARGVPLAGRRTRKAGALFLAGENPLDVKTRWLTMLRREMLDPASADVHFVDGRFNIEEQLDTIKAHIARHPTGLVVADTLQAFFDGDDSNSNDQMKAAAFEFREITKAGPAVVIPAHPKKGASRDSNVPYGGGALLNEVDGNLSLWGGRSGIEMHWCGKFRGSFDPAYFALDVCQVPDALDRDGDPITTVTARTIEADEAEAQEEALNGELMRLLTAIRDNPGASIERIGAACAPMAGLPGWSRSNTDRRINGLIARGLVEKSLGKVVLTAKGGRILGDS